MVLALMKAVDRAVFFRVGFLPLLAVMLAALPIGVTVIPTITQTLHEERVQSLSNDLDIAVSIMQDLYDRSQKGEFSEQEALAQSNRIMRAIRYNDGKDYFVIAKTDPKTCSVDSCSEVWVTVHPIHPEWEQVTNAFVLTDIKGFNFGKAITMGALRDYRDGTETLVEFWIPNRRLETITQSDLLDETKVIKKTTLSKYFAPWSLIITAATFIPDEEQKAADISESLILEYVAILVVLLVVSAAIVWQSGRNETRRIAAEENLRSLNEELELRIAERSAELEKTHAQLIQSEKMATLGEMATGVAHELNQPLNVIRMAASNIRRKTKQGESDLEHLNSKLDKIDSQVDRATAIIDHMRIFGRKTFAMHWLTPNGQTKPSQNFWQA